MSQKIKPGTRIRVHSDCDFINGVSGQEFTTIGCPPYQAGYGNDDKPWILYDGIEYYIPDDCYDVIDDTDSTIKPGTVIRVKDEGQIHPAIRGKRFTTIKCPKKFVGDSLREKIWVCMNGNEFYLDSTDYYVVSTTKQSSEVCEECKGTGVITLFTSTIVCECGTKGVSK